MHHRDLGTREVRLAYVLEKDKLKKAVEVLRHALEEYPKTLEAQSSAVQINLK